MGAVQGFMSVWSNARATFGQGEPEGGAHFDASAQFEELQSQVKSAAPGGSWTGTGADAYAEANDRQARVLGELAALDKRLSTEVDRSAAVVAAGRRDLDAVKQWVADAAATVPNTPAGERALWPVVSQGAREITGIIERSNADLAAIAGRMAGIGEEYRLLHDPLPKSPSTDDQTPGPDPQAVTNWYMDWDDLQSRIAKHNAVVPRPPWNTPAGIAYEAEREALEIEQAQKIVEAADLGVQVTSPSEPLGGS